MCKGCRRHSTGGHVLKTSHRCDSPGLDIWEIRGVGSAPYNCARLIPDPLPRSAHRIRPQPTQEKGGDKKEQTANLKNSSCPKRDTPAVGTSQREKSNRDTTEGTRVNLAGDPLERGDTNS